MEAISWLYAILQKAYGGELTEKIRRGYGAMRSVTFRVNSLKSDPGSVEKILSDEGILFSKVEWYDNAYVVENAREDKITQTELFRQGQIYLQSLSSMLPPLFLEPKADENILDMTAAPGGKTTQMSALSGGRAFITACERDKIRTERLRYNVEKQGAPRVTVLNIDAVKLDDYFQFDKILLDAPCSGSGTLYLNRQNKISEKLIDNSRKLQEQLLFKALKLLKKGGTLIYSTCSLLPCENDEIVCKALQKGDAELVALQVPPMIPRLPSMEGTLCVCPDELYEGFFVAKLKKR